MLNTRGSESQGPLTRGGPAFLSCPPRAPGQGNAGQAGWWPSCDSGPRSLPWEPGPSVPRAAGSCCQTLLHSGSRAFLGSGYPACLAAGVLWVGTVRGAREVTAGRELETWGAGIRTQACSPGEQSCPFRKLPHNTHPLGEMSKLCPRDQLGLQSQV